MLPLDTELRLGNKAYLLILQKRLKGPIFLLALTLLIQAFKTELSGVPSLSTIINILFIGSLIYLLIEFTISRIEYRHFTFKFEEFGLSIKSGFFDSKITSVPYRQIQSVSLERSLHQRMLGLSKITLTTAGHSGNTDSTVILEPIDEDLAEQIRQKLQREIGVQVIEKTDQADEESKTE